LEAIPFTSPLAALETQHEQIFSAIRGVLESGRYILGPSVESFESSFAGYLGAKFCLGTASGTDALFLALKALGIGAGDLVVTAAHTVVATLAAIEMAGAQPVLADVEHDSLTLDPDSLADILSQDDSGKVRCVIPVHLHGQPADMERILEMTRPRGIRVLEDCAQAHGARWQGRACGTLGDLGAFSFYPTKILGALGDGGAVSGMDESHGRKLRLLRQYGWGSLRESQIPGYNSRLDELQAAILKVKLGNLGNAIQARRDLAALYDRELAQLPVVLPVEREGCQRVYTQYVIRCGNRDSLAAWLAKSGVHTSAPGPLPLQRQPAYAGRVQEAPRGLPEADAACRESLSLPLFPELSPGAVGRVAGLIKAFYSGHPSERPLGA
jgi:dTDP-4-amino-4,6-dideoxygalactose transaminase